MRQCGFCEGDINQEETGEPYLSFYSETICSSCYIGIIPEIYSMAGAGDGGLIHLLFKEMLVTNHNKKRRTTIARYRTVLKKLLHKYKFMCVYCGTKENLTIDHKHPVSKGGTDEISNLQILCRSCNSKKGAKVAK